MSYLKEKLKNFGELVTTIILDALLVIIIGLTVFVVKWLIEKFYGQKIEEIGNIVFETVYKISEYLLISLVFLFATLDILLVIKKIIKRLKRNKDYE